MTRVLVFGSNTAGIHGRGAALYAREYFEAQLGVGKGPTGNAYALPTKDHYVDRHGKTKVGQPLPMDEVKANVAEFLAYAYRNPETQFIITRVGCGLAGFYDRQIAPLFSGAPENCSFDSKWKPFLRGHRFWGTFDKPL